MDSFALYLKFQKEVTESKLKAVNRFLKGTESRESQRTSKAETVENVLKVAGRPLHVAEIIDIAKRDFQVKLERDSIVSILIKKIKAGQKFIRTAPNTFALKEKKSFHSQGGLSDD